MVNDVHARKLDDVRIENVVDVASPQTVQGELPVTEPAARTTFEARQAMRRVFAGEDDRVVVVVGPCSIHDPEAALDYAGRLAALRGRLADDLLVVMRVYFEKPRTTVGWKGLINDPDLDGTFRINHGLRVARRLLLDLGEMGMPSGVEFLDVFTPQYLADLVAWGAIGARTTESQLHRQLASGLSCPVGFKNGTTGNVRIAVDAIGAAREPHHFLGVTKDGRAGIFETTGNGDCHVILRGGAEPNYRAEDVARTSAMLEGAGLPARIMIDFSHANSAKRPRAPVGGGRGRGGPDRGRRPAHRRRDDREQPDGRAAGRPAGRAARLRTEHHRRLPRMGGHGAAPRPARGGGARPPRGGEGRHGRLNRAGSGGFPIQAHRYVEEQGGNADDPALYGQDSNGTTWSICNVNMILHNVTRFGSTMVGAPWSAIDPVCPEEQPVIQKRTPDEPAVLLADAGPAHRRMP